MDCVLSLRNSGTTVMRRCNHCDGQLGLIVQRKRMLRFCSKPCKKAYEHKLEEERRKLRHLAFLTPGAQTNYWAGPSK
jgi:HD superfamily phosphodiesterase